MDTNLNPEKLSSEECSKRYIKEKVDAILLAIVKSKDMKQLEEDIRIIIDKTYDDGYSDGQDNPDLDDMREGMAEEASFRRDSMD